MARFSFLFVFPRFMVILHFERSFRGLNIPQNSPYLEHMSHLAKNVIIQCHWVWLWPAGSIVPQIITPRLLDAHTWMKFSAHICHEQTHKKISWTNTVAPTGSCPFWCWIDIFHKFMPFWKLPPPTDLTPQSLNSLSIILKPWRSKVAKTFLIGHTNSRSISWN